MILLTTSRRAVSHPLSCTLGAPLVLLSAGRYCTHAKRRTRSKTEAK